jgi:hypothetical protein
MQHSYFGKAAWAAGRAGLLSALLLLSGGVARAQVSAYSFAASAGSFTPLPAAATTVAAVQTDDAVSVALPLGFTFQYDGLNYTEVVASSNGFLSFNPQATATFTNELAVGPAGNRPLVAPLWDDLAGTDASSRASYETTGTAPNRVFTFEWLNWKWYRFAQAPGISFQVRLYEGSNVVEFDYHPEAGALMAPTASIGLSGSGTGSGSFLSLSNSSAAPTASPTTETSTISTKPADGQAYIFTPGAATCLAPRNLTITNITATTARVNFTGNANATSYTVTYTAAGGSPQTVTGATSPITLTGLTAPTTYAVSVVSNCAGGQTSIDATAIFSTTVAAYCTANLGGGNCVANQLISAVSITGTTLNNTTNNCQTTNGSSYAIFPAAGSTTATLTSGSYTIRVTSTSGGQVGMWIDYDQNSTFDPMEYTLITAQAVANQAATATFTVPAAALSGSTRLRVRTRAAGAAGQGIRPADACTNFTTGQTEDYLISIGAPASCAAVTNVRAANITGTTANIAFGATAGATSYTVTYTPQGGTPATVTPSPTASPVALTGLSTGTTYMVSVVANCANGASAAATVTFTTTTTTTPPANDNCAAAVAVPVTPDCTAPTTGTVLAATQSLAPTANCGPAQAAPDVWYSFVATGTAHYISLAAQFNAVLDVRSGSCANSTSVFCAQQAAGTQTRTVTGLTVGSTYFVRVYYIGPAPAANASGFGLCINLVPAPPANDNCTAAVTVPVTTDCSAPTLGTVLAATQTLAPTANCGGGAQATANDVWYSFTATGTSHVITLLPGFDGAIVDVRTGSCTNSTSFSCGNYVARASSSRQINGLSIGTTYLMRVYSLQANQPVGQAAGFALCVSPVPVLPANDDCAAAINVPVTVDCTTSTSGSVAAATQSLNPTANCGQGVMTANDVWYSFTATATTHAVGLAAQFAGILDIRSGTCASSTSIYCNTVALNNPRTAILTTLTVGSTYFVRIYPSAGTPVGASAAFQLCVTTIPPVPANDDPCGAVALSTGTLVNSTTSGATTTALPGITQPSCSNATAPRDVWFVLTPTGTTAQLNFTGVAAGMVRVYTAQTCSTRFTLVNCYQSAGVSQSIGSIILTGLTAGTRYYVAVAGFGNNTVNGAFTVTSAAVLNTHVQMDSNALLLYPNPSNTGQLTLRLQGGQSAGQATLLNALGQTVLSKALTAGTAGQALSTRGLAAGLYTLRVQLGEAVLTRKVVLE